MKMCKIKLLLIMLCGAFSMPSLASDDMEIEETAAMGDVEVSFRGMSGNLLGKKAVGRVYEGMSYTVLDRYLKNLFSIRPDVNLSLLITREDKVFIIEPASRPEKDLDGEVFDAILSNKLVGIFFPVVR